MWVGWEGPAGKAVLLWGGGDGWWWGSPESLMAADTKLLGSSHSCPGLRVQNRPRVEKCLRGLVEHLSTRELSGRPWAHRSQPGPNRRPLSLPSPLHGDQPPQIPAVDGVSWFSAGLHPGCLPSPLVPSLSHPQGLAPARWSVQGSSGSHLDAVSGGGGPR